jgi:simple sugar transport system permease protein
LEILDLVWSVAFLVSAVRLAMPIVVAAVGEAISERAGMLNIGIEGMMLTGAFCGVVAADLTGDVWLGVLGGMLGTIAITVPHGVLTITLAGNQIVSGVALNLGALGLTTYLYRSLYGIDARPKVAHFDPVHLPGLSDLPIVGPVLFGQVPIAYVVVALAFVGWFVLARTRWGLHWRASGEEPDGLDAVGVSVARVRWSALLVCAALAGLAGTILSLGQLNTFVEGMTGGRGFIVLALVIVARWDPRWALLVGIFFGAVDAIGLRVQALGITFIPYQIALMLPYVLTLAAYAFVAHRGRAPRALGRGYFKP